MDKLSGYVVVQAVYNGETYKATLTLRKIINGDKYDLIIKPAAISYNSSTNNPSTTNITIEIWKTVADGTRGKEAPPQNYSTYILDGVDTLTSSKLSTFTYSCTNSLHGDITVKIAKDDD